MITALELEIFCISWKNSSFYALTTSNENQIEQEKLSAFCKELNETRRKAFSSGNCVDIWGIDEIGRQELHYSAILAWLLDENGDHGQGRVFLDELLNLVNERLLSKQGDNDVICISPYKVRTEVVATAKERLDILLESPHTLLAIEVKVDATEHNDQLQRYAEWLHLRAHTSGRAWCLLYVTKDGKLGSTEKALPICWRVLGRRFELVLKQIVSTRQEFESSIAFWAIQQFIWRVCHI